MRRDAIFYQIFQRFPGLLFEFVEHPPAEASRYRFESVEVKEPNFRIDGVFLPPDDASAKTVYFAEVQFQKDEDLYHRFVAESMLYLYRNRAMYEDWYGVVIFPSRSLEPENQRVHRSLLNGDQLRRIYLDELEGSEEQPIGIRLMQLTIAPEDVAITQAKALLEEAEAATEGTLARDMIIEVVTTIAVYKFTNFSREEVEAMLGLQLEDSRILREAKEEGERKKALEILMRQLARRVGEMEESLKVRVEQLSNSQLDELSEVLLDFAGVEDLLVWLEGQPGQE